MKLHPLNRFLGPAVRSMVDPANKPQKQALLAVSASALMLGASQAGTTVGINFQGNYYGYDSGAPIAATALGIPAGDWTNAPDASSGATTAGSISVNWSCANTWNSWIWNSDFPDAGIPSYPDDGNAYYGYLDDGGSGYSVNLSGLATSFPGGYVVQTLAATDNGTGFRDVEVTDGVNPSTMSYTVFPQFWWGAVAGYSDQSSTFTSDTLAIHTTSSGGSGGNIRATLAGVIITDKPVVTRPLVGTAIADGETITLSAEVLAHPTGLHYQWRQTTSSGTVNVGTDSPTYTVTGATMANAGDYELVITNNFGTATSNTVAVTVAAPYPYIWVGNASGTWDIETTQNWTANGSASTYADGVDVELNDNATRFDITATETVSPYSLSVTNSAHAYTIGGSPIAGIGRLIKSGTNSLTLTGANSYSGGTIIEGGMLQIGDGITNGQGTGTYVIDSGAVFKLNYNSAGAHPPYWAAISGPGKLVLKSAKSFDYGWGQASLTGSFTGTLQIEGGRASTNGAGSLGATTEVVIVPGGHLGMWEGGSFPQNFTIAGTGYGEPGYEAALRFANGGKTTTITGNMTLSGNATIAAGGTGVITGVVSGGSGAALSFGTSQMAGTMELAGANDYAGATAINLGRLVVSGTMGATAVSVASSATLDAGSNITGNAALGASVSINSGGHFAFHLAATPASQVTRTLTGSLTLSAGNFVDLYAGTQPADGTYTLVSASSIAGTPGAGATLALDPGRTATLSVVGGTSLVLTISSGGYDSWVNGFSWPVGADKTRTGNPDGDGFTNLQEFLFGTSPVAGSGALITSQRSGGNLVIRWKQRISGATYALKRSSTLGNDWVTSPASVSNDGAPTGDYQPKMATVAIGAGRDFYRVEGTEN